VTQVIETRLDSEAVCTRIVSRLIKELGCVDIAPDSPAWQDVLRRGARIGELRVYRGRGRVQKVVGSHFRLDELGYEAHTLAVFTTPDSGVPHFILDSARTGSSITFRVDLLPKRDLGVSLEYLDVCFSPLTQTREDLHRDGRFVEGSAPLRHRALFSPWLLSYTAPVEHLAAARSYIERYFAHWAGLLRGDSAQLAPAADLASRDAAHRQLLFSRDLDPIWSTLEPALGAETVQLLLSAFSR
jgi:hypothetical protein